MKRVMMIAGVLAFGFALSPMPAQSAGNCAGANCGTKAKQELMPGQVQKKPVPPKKVIRRNPHVVAQKPGKGRSDYSADERAKLMENARAVCREHYGASSTVYRVDYKKWRVTCVPPGY